MIIEISNHKLFLSYLKTFLYNFQFMSLSLTHYHQHQVKYSTIISAHSLISNSLVIINKFFTIQANLKVHTTIFKIIHHIILMM